MGLDANPVDLPTLASASGPQTSPNRLSTEYQSRPFELGVAAAAAGQNDTPNPPVRHDVRPSNRAQDLDLDLRDILQRIQKLEESSASNPIHGQFETGRDIPARQSGLLNTQIILNKTRILRWSHWMGTAPEVQSGFSPACNFPLTTLQVRTYHCLLQSG